MSMSHEPTRAMIAGQLRKDLQVVFGFLDNHLMDLAFTIHEINVNNGFWDSAPQVPALRGQPFLSEKIALIHTEVSELLEATRTKAPLADEHCPNFTSEEIEAADILIRLLDYAYARQLRLSEAIRAKLEYNLTRPFRHNKRF